MHLTLQGPASCQFNQGQFSWGETVNRKSIIACGVSLSVLLTAGASFAQQRTFDVPAGPAVKSIPEFARQAGLQIVAPADQLKGVTTPPLTGVRDARAALSALIAGTNLEIASDEGGVVSLRNAKAASAEPPRSPTAATGTAVVSQAPAGIVQEVVVTGSRVIANGNNAPTPVTVVGTQELLQAQPGTVALALQNLPIFDGSQGQTSNTGGGNATGPNGSASGVNIRNLGLYRALVLYDGHRIPPTSNTGFVTIDMIPQMLLQRVDVVTGGASAVYGSEAVSGVANFITDTHFNGLKMKAQVGVSEIGDDKTQDYGAAFGTSLFGGRGHFEASLEYLQDPGIFSFLSRDFGRNTYALLGSVPGSPSLAGSAANPFKLYSTVRSATSSFGGRINNGPLSGQNFSTNGVLTPFQAGVLTGTANSQSGGEGSFVYNTSQKTALESKQVFARFDYDLTDVIHGYVEAAGTQNHNTYNNTTLSLANVSLSARNAFLAPVYQNAMPATSTFRLSKVPQQFPAASVDFYTKQYFLNTGLDGAFGAGFKWDLSYAHSYAFQNQRVNRNFNYQHLYAALDAVMNPATGQVVCNITLTNPGLYNGCLPLNLFGPTSESAAAVALITDQTQSWTTTTLDDVTGSITGAPLSTWAGPINMALSMDLRKMNFEGHSNSQPSDLADCTGIRFNCVQGTTLAHQTSFANRSTVSQTVKEVAFEFDAPLLKDAPLAKELNLNGAVRFTNYDTSGDATTWKVGLGWRVNDELTLRAARSRDIRAPNLYDLFWPLSLSHGDYTDALTNATLLNIGDLGGSNRDLKPEVGNTKTAGFVYRPEWFAGFSFSIDAYDIEITDAIQEITGTSTQVQKGCIASGGTSNYCSLVVRPFPNSNTTTANNATLFKSIPINIASIRTYGADFEANYATQLFGRPFSVRGLMTYQPHLTIITPGLSEVDMGGAAGGGGQGVGATPRVRLTAFINYSPIDDFSISVLQKWHSSLDWSGDHTLVYVDPKIPAVAATNLNLAYAFHPAAGKTEVYFNVQNLFNKSPPPSAGRIGGDDYIGRFYTLGVRFTH